MCPSRFAKKTNRIAVPKNHRLETMKRRPTFCFPSCVAASAPVWLAQIYPRPPAGTAHTRQRHGNKKQITISATRNSNRQNKTSMRARRDAAAVKTNEKQRQFEKQQQHNRYDTADNNNSQQQHLTATKIALILRNSLHQKQRETPTTLKTSP